MKLHERLKENRELGRAEGRIEGLSKVIKVIRNLNRAGHDSEYIADLMDENINLVEKVIGMIESDPDINDTAIAEAILSQVEF